MSKIKVNYISFEGDYKVSKETAIHNRTVKIMNSICKECGRKDRISRMFCNDCWKETVKTIKGVDNK